MRVTLPDGRRVYLGVAFRFAAAAFLFPGAILHRTKPPGREVGYSYRPGSKLSGLAVNTSISVLTT